MTVAPLFFGCVSQAGHYYWTPDLRRVRSSEDARVATPWGLAVDGRLTPKAAKAQGAAALHHRDGWTALAIHDYTVDSRPGSNAVFCFPEVLDFDGALTAAREHFPTIVERIGRVSLIEAP